MSVFDRRVPLTEGQRGEVRRLVTAAAKQSFEGHVSPREMETVSASPEFLELRESAEAFFQAVYEKAGERSFFSPEERAKLIREFQPAVERFFAALREADERRLREFMDATPSSVQETLDAYDGDLSSIEQALAGQPDEEERACLEAIHEDLSHQRFQLLLEVRAGRLRLSDRLSTQEQTAFERDVREHQTASLEPSVTSQKVVTDMVDEYERILVAHKILIGLEANYPDEEILAHLEEVIPPHAVLDVRRELEALKKKRREGQPPEVTSLHAYGRILRAVFGDRKAFAAGLGGAAIFLGYLAPQMARQLGEFGRSGRVMDAGEGAAYGLGSALAQTELHRRLSQYLNTRLFGEAGLTQQMTASIIGSSPELFTKTDQGLIRRYTEQTIEAVEQVSMTTIEGIGVRLSRIVGLASASAMRMQNPALFGPVVLAAAINTYIAMKGGRDISASDRAVRETSAAFAARFDEAVQIRVGRGQVRGSEPEALSRLEAARRDLVETVNRYQRASGVVMPVVMLLNALLMDRSQPDFFADYAEASIYSLQLSGELSELVREVSGLHRSLQPVVELANLTTEFREGGREEPHDWELELIDVKRKALTVSRLHVTPGDLITVVGESGAGKSTLLEVLYGFRTDRGYMMVDDIMPSNLQKRAFRDRIAVSNQFYVVESRSVRDNIVSPDLPFQADVFRDVLAQHGFDAWLQKAAGGGDVEALAQQFTLNRDAQLSGGERKRFSLMAIDYRLRVAPDSLKMILLDEPTSGLDARHKREVFATIARWRREHPDKTVVIVNHDSELFSHLPPDSRVVGIEKDGRLTQDESLESARTHEEAPFYRVFGGVERGSL